MVGFPDVCKRQEAAPRRWMKLRVLGPMQLITLAVLKKRVHWKTGNSCLSVGSWGNPDASAWSAWPAIETPNGGAVPLEPGGVTNNPQSVSGLAIRVGWHLPLICNGMACWKSWIKKNWRGWRHLILFFHNRCRSLLDDPNCLSGTPGPSWEHPYESGSIYL